MRATLFCVLLSLVITVSKCAESISGSGVLPPYDGYYFQYYEIYVPQNASRVSVSITNTSPDSVPSCYNVYEYVKVGGQPCSDALFNGANNLCLQRVDFAPSLYGGNHTTTLTFDSGDEWYQFAVGQDLFIGVGTELNYGSNCSFEISANVESCDSTEVGLFDYYAVPGPVVECIKYYTIEKNGDTFDLSGDSPSNSVYYLEVPANIAWVEATLYASSNPSFESNTAFSITGRNFGASNTDIAFNCSTHSYSFDNDTSSYVYSILCDAPSSGVWFWTVRNGGMNTTFDGQITFAWQECSDTAGYQCAYPLTNLSVIPAHSFEVTLLPPSMANNESNLSFGAECNYEYYMFANEAQWQENVNVTCATEGLGWMYVRRNGFPTSYIYDLAVNCTANGIASWVPQDFYPAGNWYLALCNPNAESATFAVSVSSTNASSSTSSSSTGSTTGGTTTTFTTFYATTTGPVDVTTDSTTGLTGNGTSTDATTDSKSSSFGIQLEVASSLLAMKLALLLMF